MISHPTCQPRAEPVRRFNIHWGDRGYTVDIPNYGGGEVVEASAYEALCNLHFEETKRSNSFEEAYRQMNEAFIKASDRIQELEDALRGMIDLAGIISPYNLSTSSESRIKRAVDALEAK